MRIPLIDLSNGIFAIHQNHSYNFKGFESKNDVLNSNDGLLNQQEIGENTLNLLDANYYYSNSSIKKNNTIPPIDASSSPPPPPPLVLVFCRREKRQNLFMVVMY